MIEYLEPSSRLDLQSVRTFLSTLEREQEKPDWSGNRLAVVLGISHARVHARIGRLKKYGIIAVVGTSGPRNVDRFRVDWNRFEEIERRQTSA